MLSLTYFGGLLVCWVSLYCSHWWAPEKVLLMWIICHPELRIISFFFSFWICLLTQCNFLGDTPINFIYFLEQWCKSEPKKKYQFCESRNNTKDQMSVFYVVVQVYPCNILLPTRTRTQIYIYIYFFSGTDTYSSWYSPVYSGKVYILVVPKYF